MKVKAEQEININFKQVFNYFTKLDYDYFYKEVGDNFKEEMFHRLLNDDSFHIINTSDIESKRKELIKKFKRHYD